MNKLKLSAFILTICCLSVTFCQAAEKSRLVFNLESGKQQTIIMYGTSLTASGEWVKQLKGVLNSCYPGKAKIINSGNKVGMWSKWGVENLDELVIKKKPDSVFIEFAINDAYLPYKMSVAQAQRNLEEMIERILRSNANCEIVLMVMNPPILSHLERRPKIKDYYQMYRDVARNRNCILIDHFPKWEKILKEDPKLFWKLVPDGIHPGPEGCKAVITPNIIKALGIKTE